MNAEVSLFSSKISVVNGIHFARLKIFPDLQVDPLSICLCDPLDTP
jgi:hypothetical protein